MWRSVGESRPTRGAFGLRGDEAPRMGSFLAMKGSYPNFAYRRGRWGSPCIPRRGGGPGRLCRLGEPRDWFPGVGGQGRSPLPSFRTDPRNSVKNHRIPGASNPRSRGGSESPGRPLPATRTISEPPFLSREGEGDEKRTRSESWARRRVSGTGRRILWLGSINPSRILSRKQPCARLTWTSLNA